MNKAISNSIIRFFLLWAIQVFVLRQITWGWGGETFLLIHLYPLFILLLPFNTPRLLLLPLGLLLGLSVDWIYHTWGVHASALVFTAYMRDFVLSILTPREGYSAKDLPTKSSLGDSWFLKYASLMLLLHLLFYFSVEAFTFVYFKSILLKLLFSWLGSMFFLLLSIYITNPKA
jgi:hypothetical protein